MERKFVKKYIITLKNRMGFKSYYQAHKMSDHHLLIETSRFRDYATVLTYPQAENICQTISYATYSELEIEEIVVPKIKVLEGAVDLFRRPTLSPVLVHAEQIRLEARPDCKNCGICRKCLG